MQLRIIIFIINKSGGGMLVVPCIGVVFFVKRVALSYARNVPCDGVTGDESLHTNDNVTLLHRRDYDFDMLSE